MLHSTDLSTASSYTAYHPALCFSRAKTFSPAPESLALLDALIADDSISEILINRFDCMYIERNGKLQEMGVEFDAPETVDLLADTLMARCGLGTADQAHCVLDGTLPGGARVNIVLPPVAVDGTSISIRKFPHASFTLDSLTATGFMTAEMADFLKTAVHARMNIIVSGGASSGKTTLLNALGAFSGKNERIITLEDTPELRLQHGNVVRLTTRGNGFDAGSDAITLRHLVKTSLRMRPDRLIVGEVRGEEALDLMHALNTGHSGCMSTVHANSPRDALTRLSHLMQTASSGPTAKCIQEHIPLSFELIVQTKRDASGARRVTHVTEVLGTDGGKFILQDLFGGDASPAAPALPRNPKLRKAEMMRREALGWMNPVKH